LHNCFDGRENGYGFFAGCRRSRQPLPVIFNYRKLLPESSYLLPESMENRFPSGSLPLQTNTPGPAWTISIIDTLLSGKIERWDSTSDTANTNVGLSASSRL
jgi:hypothetical protein